MSAYILDVCGFSDGETKGSNITHSLLHTHVFTIARDAPMKENYIFWGFPCFNSRGQMHLMIFNRILVQNKTWTVGSALVPYFCTREPKLPILCFLFLRVGWNHCCYLSSSAFVACSTYICRVESESWVFAYMSRVSERKSIINMLQLYSWFLLFGMEACMTS